MEIYCDWAATAPFDQQIMKQAFELSLENGGNPSSVHQKGIQAKKILSQARERCASALGVKPNQIFFTGGGTESNYLPITSLLRRPTNGSIVVSNIEHPSVIEMVNSMKCCNKKIIEVPCNSNGIISPESVMKVLRDDTDLVCIMAVNNETGAIQPIYEISDALTQQCKGKKRPKFHIDCVQAAGKIPLNLAYEGIDSSSISAHKIGAARGCGILYLKERQEPFIKGGGQEGGLRSGTENIFGALSISFALEKYFILNEKSINYKNYIIQKNLTLKFIEKLKTIDKCILIPQTRNSDYFSPYIIQAAFKNIPGEVLVRALSEKQIYISTGSACSSRKQKRPILDAMKIDKNVASWGVRFSFGYSTTEHEMNVLFDSLKDVVNKF
ncbi:MAG: cysteine desulfurase family protein [Treponemataceae bacterium]